VCVCRGVYVCVWSVFVCVRVCVVCCEFLCGLCMVVKVCVCVCVHDYHSAPHNNMEVRTSGLQRRSLKTLNTADSQHWERYR
jgi:hypothetical protein